MTRHRHLPTFIRGTWDVTDFLDTLVESLDSDRTCKRLSMYFYAVTKAGWEQLRDPILNWKKCGSGRSVLLVVGTDHGITDPRALEEIQQEGIEVRIMLNYNGIFHPKVVWLAGRNKHIVWVGSNNLTRDGLLNNIEFALLIQSKQTPGKLQRWTQSLKKSSVVLTSELLMSYAKQRRKFEKGRVKRELTSFVWQERTDPLTDEPKATKLTGGLIVQVMPRETGKDGRQLQLPIKAAEDFFGISGKGSTKQISLRSKHESEFKQLIMKIFSNHTVRLVISDLEHRDRPCVLEFQKLTESEFEYEIVPESIFPRRYAKLLALCTSQTRSGSRRWGRT